MEACRHDNTTPSGFSLPWSNSIISRLPANKPSLVSRTVCSYFGKTSASSDYKRLKWIHDNGLVFLECDQQAKQNASSFVLLFEEMCCLFKWCGQKLVPMWDKLPNLLCQRCLWGVPEMTTDPWLVGWWCIESNQVTGQLSLHTDCQTFTFSRHFLSKFVVFLS